MASILRYRFEDTIGYWSAVVCLVRHPIERPLRLFWADAVPDWSLRILCRAFALHNRTCRGRRGHSPDAGRWIWL